VARLQSELDLQLWHLDEPVGSTSQFSQWCVFAGAASAGLKVMLDGQGSDEQLAGYNGGDAPLYAGLMRRGAIGALASEMMAYRRRHGAIPRAQLLLAARSTAPAINALLSARLTTPSASPDWLRDSGAGPSREASVHDLGAHLRRQLLDTSLPVLLRYEDRNSMAWSIESRVPFLDYRLVEFLAGVPDRMKLRRGVTKVVFREAMRGILPEAVRTRTDKMGFVTPEDDWLARTATEWFRAGVVGAIEAVPDLLNADRVIALVDETIRGERAFSFVPWRILCLGRWLTSVASGTQRPSHTPAGIGA
jgi:asparagine synthase (glutamine-hydrolysing)